jgi:hypothetical protein
VNRSNAPPGRRASYAQAGTAIRLAARKANRAELPPSAWKVLVALFGLIPSYSRLEDALSAERVAQEANVPLTTTRKALRLLAKLDIINYDSQRGRGHVGLIRFPLSDRPDGSLNHGLADHLERSLKTEDELPPWKVSQNGDAPNQPLSDLLSDRPGRSLPEKLREESRGLLAKGHSGDATEQDTEEGPWVVVRASPDGVERGSTTYTDRDEAQRVAAACNKRNRRGFTNYVVEVAEEETAA